VDDIDLLADLHLRGSRQGPGSDDATRRAIDLSGLRGAADLTIADLGCGSGASTVVLAEDLDAHITAIDLFPEFLERLDSEARRRGLANRITTVVGSMDDLDLGDGSLDAIWSEGAIYNIGFEHGVRSWRRLLRPGGVLAVSELTWLTADRPAELEAHWSGEYTEVDTASAKIAVLERCGYSPIGYFTLQESCWLDHYYRPLQARFDDFLARNASSDAAQAVVEAEGREIELYERFSAYVGYGFYVATRLPD
jgi:SAM-dependent methyltransferase